MERPRHGCPSDAHGGVAGGPACTHHSKLTDGRRRVPVSVSAASVESLVLLDGQGAIGATRLGAPDIVVLDLTELPVLDGWYVLAELGGRSRFPAFHRRAVG